MTLSVKIDTDNLTVSWPQTTKMCSLPILRVACRWERHCGTRYGHSGIQHEELLRCGRSIRQGESSGGTRGWFKCCSPEVTCITHNSWTRTCPLAPPHLRGPESSVKGEQHWYSHGVWLEMRHEGGPPGFWCRELGKGIHWKRESGIGGRGSGLTKSL